MRMKAIAATAVGKLGMIELDAPKPGEFDCLVKLEACAICNSTDHKLMMHQFYPGPFPTVLGHESVSRVVEAGSKVRNFKVGDRVFRQRLTDAQVPGGCSRWGGFSEYGIITDEWAKQDKAYGPESLPHDQQKLLIDATPAQATAMITLMETLDCAANNCGIAAGQSVAIVGSGPVGQAFAMFARCLGAKTVMAFGRRPDPAVRFKKVSRVDAYIAGKPGADVQAVIQRGGFDKVIEAVGSAEALRTSLELAGTKGQVFVYGVAPDSNPYGKDDLARPNVKRVGAREGRVQAQLVDYVKAGKVRLDDWVSHQFPFNRFQEAFDLVFNQHALKAVLLPDA